MKKNQTIVLAIIVIVVLGGLVAWSLVQKPEVPFEKEEEEEELAEVFSMSAVVSSVDAVHSFLMVKPANQEGEVKVLVSETTRLIKL